MSPSNDSTGSDAAADFERSAGLEVIRNSSIRPSGSPVAVVNSFAERTNANAWPSDPLARSF